jgi:hypothetical protein
MVGIVAVEVSGLRNCQPASRTAGQMHQRFDLHVANHVPHICMHAQHWLHLTMLGQCQVT